MYLILPRNRHGSCIEFVVEVVVAFVQTHSFYSRELLYIEEDIEELGVFATRF